MALTIKGIGAAKPKPEKKNGKPKTVRLADGPYLEVTETSKRWRARYAFEDRNSCSLLASIPRGLSGRITRTGPTNGINEKRLPTQIQSFHHAARPSPPDRAIFHSVISRPVFPCSFFPQRRRGALCLFPIPLRSLPLSIRQNLSALPASWQAEPETPSSASKPRMSRSV